MVWLKIGLTLCGLRCLVSLLPVRRYQTAQGLPGARTGHPCLLATWGVRWNQVCCRTETPCGLRFVYGHLDLKPDMSQFKQSEQKQSEILGFWVQLCSGLYHIRSAWLWPNLTGVEHCENWHAGVISGQCSMKCSIASSYFVFLSSVTYYAILALTTWNVEAKRFIF